ncbi:hypothetical protein C0V72_06305 [Porphyrobacter sp. TH134]|uniref:hypothetical protein n=1 Tax=Porphyrobacter sp. TH134 TaxID=2067450 RepID=UPI000C7A6E32|nr:hypothetical protein [Porphyrobacter sp. TH134]PLK24174.1 hypothetical protein C0V72_06305 [Porphyrobacter sp. TH134]
MTRSPSSARGGHGWQLILADLALILFLLTLSALPAAEAKNGRRLAHWEAREKEALGALEPDIAPAQALFRPVPGGPSLGAWLAAQTPDPRATLTIFSTHREGAEAAAWAQAEALAAEARASGTRVRTIITIGAEADLYASLAYDAVVADNAVRRSTS